MGLVSAISERPDGEDVGPIRLLERELTLPIEGVERMASRFGEPYRRATLLVRLHGEPLGTVDLALNSGAAEGEHLARKIWAAFGPIINQHLEGDARPPIDALSSDGIGESTPCRADRLAAGANPTVSVVVPTRDRPESLARCLASLRRLDYPHFDVVVVDNAPTSSLTAEVVARHRGPVPVRYVLEARPGSSVARNRGLAEATGGIVAFTDDDVMVDPAWLRAIVRRFESEPGLTCVTGLVLPAELETPSQLWFEQYGGFNKGYRPRTFDRDGPGEGRLYPYAAGVFGSGNNVAFDADALRDLGGFDVRLGPGTATHAGEDLGLFVDVITSGGRLAYEPSAIVRHFHRSDYDALRRQLRDYGVGLGAMLTSQAVRGPRPALHVLGRLPLGAKFLLSPSSAKNVGRDRCFPRALARAELRGLVRGPAAYARSRHQTRRDKSNPRPRGSGSAIERLRIHLGIPLFRNAYALMLTTFVTACLGVVYWALAARHYRPVDVGRASAAISAMLLISGIAQLNMISALPRFLPRAGAMTRRLVAHAYLATASLAVVLSAAFILAARDSSFLSGPMSRVLGVWFAAAVIVWCVFTLQDSVLAGLRQAVWIPVENGLFAAAKIALLIVFAPLSQRLGIFASWTIPVAISLIPVNLLIFRRLVPRHMKLNGGRSALPTRRQLGHFIAADYVGGLFQLCSVTVLPLIVVAELGLAANAYFYTAWVVATSFELLLGNIGVSLLVESANDETRVAEHARRVARLGLVLVVPAALLLAVAAPLVLSLLGPDYAAEGTTLLRLLALGMLFRMISVLFLSLARVHRRIRQIVAVQATTCTLLLALSLLLLPRVGLAGVGWAYLVTQMIVGGAVLPSVVRDLRTDPRASLPAASGPARPGPVPSASAPPISGLDPTAAPTVPAAQR